MQVICSSWVISKIYCLLGIYNTVIFGAIVIDKISVYWVIHVTCYEIFCWFVHCKWLTTINAHAQSGTHSGICSIHDTKRENGGFPVVRNYFEVSSRSTASLPVEILSEFIPFGVRRKDFSSNKVFDRRRGRCCGRSITDTFHITIRYKIELWKLKIDN